MTTPFQAVQVDMNDLSIQSLIEGMTSAIEVVREAGCGGGGSCGAGCGNASCGSCSGCGCGCTGGCGASCGGGGGFNGGG